MNEDNSGNYFNNSSVCVIREAVPGRAMLKRGMLRPAFASRRQPLHQESRE
jgi:hypothetical protein